MLFLSSLHLTSSIRKPKASALPVPLRTQRVQKQKDQYHYSQTRLFLPQRHLPFDSQDLQPREKHHPCQSDVQGEGSSKAFADSWHQDGQYSYFQRDIQGEFQQRHEDWISYWWMQTILDDDKKFDEAPLYWDKPFPECIKPNLLRLYFINLTCWRGVHFPGLRIVAGS